jgi:hypothetical protein
MKGSIGGLERLWKQPQSVVALVLEAISSIEPWILVFYSYNTGFIETGRINGDAQFELICEP